jgi:hypothetical protein
MLAATVAPLFCDASLQGRYSQGTPQSAIVYAIRRSLEVYSLASQVGNLRS